MRFVFLGTGTSAGVPAIGCVCAVCTSEDTRDRRLRTAAALRFTDVKGQERVILLDAGPDLRQQALRAGLTRCDAILFTHNHVDHTFGLDEVRRFNAVQKSPIDVWADDHTMGHLRRVYAHIFEREKNVNDSFVATLIPRLIERAHVEDGLAIELWGVIVKPIRLLHGRLPVLGFRIDLDEALRATVSPEAAAMFPLAYCTDVSGVPNESWKHLFGLRTLVLDALRHRHHPTHLTLNQAVHMASELKTPRVYFVHMAHDLGHAETQADLPPGMFLAWDGLELG